MDEKKFAKELSKYRQVRSKDWIGSKIKAKKYNKYEALTTNKAEEELNQQKEKEIIQNKKIENKEVDMELFKAITDYLRRQNVKQEN